MVHGCRLGMTIYMKSPLPPFTKGGFHIKGVPKRALCCLGSPAANFKAIRHTLDKLSVDTSISLDYRILTGTWFECVDHISGMLLNNRH